VTPEERERLSPPDLDAEVARALGLPPAAYSADIGATWELIARMRDRGFPLDLTGPDDEEREHWTAAFGAARATAATPGVATCLAALIAFESAAA
jgi:hypothetical protein